MEAESEAELTGSESRVDVAPKDEPVGIVGDMGYGLVRRPLHLD